MLLENRSKIVINFTVLLIHITIIYSILGLKILNKLVGFAMSTYLANLTGLPMCLLVVVFNEDVIDVLVCRRRCRGSALRHRWVI